MNKTDAIMITAFTILVMAFFACSKQESVEIVPAGKIVNGVYKNDSLGWEFRIPEGWTILSNKKINRIKRAGKKAIEETHDEQVKTSTPLLYLQKDKYNRFSSSTQTYDIKQEGNYQKRQKHLFETIISTYESKDLSFDYQKGEERLGNITFKKLQITMQSPDEKKVTLHQIIYNRLVNNRPLTICVIYNNETDKKTIKDALKQSEFEIGSY